MKYTIKDVETLPLIAEYQREFTKEVMEIFNLERCETPSITNLIYQAAQIPRYRSSPEYLAANTPRERARVAFEYNGVNSCETIVQIWLKYANQMTALEKSMLGWSDKRKSRSEW